MIALNVHHLKKTYLVGFVILFLTKLSALSAQDSTLWRLMENVQQDSLQKHVFTLASDAYEGRGAGEIGQKKAAQYLRHCFQTAGLSPVIGNPPSYFQPFPLSGKSVRVKEVFIKPTNKAPLDANDFYLQGNFEITTQTREVVWMGYGIRPSDYEVVDVAGKIVMILLDNSEEGLAFWHDPYEKIKLAKQHEAFSVFFVHPTEFDYLQNQQRSGVLERLRHETESLADPETTDFGRFFIRPKSAAKILGKSREDFLKLIEALRKNPNQTNAGLYRSEVQLKVGQKSYEAETENVIGFLEGTDLKHEVVIVGAHYDHLGFDKSIYNGADDNASGTAALLELVRVLGEAAQNGIRPRRSVLFIAFSGEEKGLLGSQFYSLRPLFSMEKTAIFINMDMIGRAELDRQNYFRLFILGNKEPVRINETIVKSTLQRIRLDYTYNSRTHPEQFYYRSDHYHFAKYDVPFIYFTTGLHDDYHSPSDDANKIDFNSLTTISRIVLGNLWYWSMATAAH